MDLIKSIINYIIHFFNAPDVIIIEHEDEWAPMYNVDVATDEESNIYCEGKEVMIHG